MAYVLVLYYSRNGKTMELAQHIATGIETTILEAKLRTVPILAPVTKVAEPAVPASGDPYVTLTDISGCSGLAMGSPTRFGNMAAPLKYFLDQTSELWLAGSLVGKPATVFTSTSSMHGGQEATLLSMMLPLFHQGMLLLGTPYTEAALATTTTGGTPYGVTHYAGINNEHAISSDEKALAIATGRRLAEVALKLM